MKQIYHHVDNWECAESGMYDAANVTEDDLKDAVRVLTRQCRSAMEQVVEQWPTSCEQVFSDPARNRRAWLGRAAVFIRSGHPVDVTRGAWYLLTPPERDRANRVANKIIAEWERRHGCQNDLWA